MPGLSEYIVQTILDSLHPLEHPHVHVYSWHLSLCPRVSVYMCVSPWSSAYFHGSMYVSVCLWMSACALTSAHPRGVRQGSEPHAACGETVAVTLTPAVGAACASCPVKPGQI